MGSTTGSIIITVTGKEISVGAHAPSNPLNNDLWLDTNIDKLKIYNGTEWAIVNDVSGEFTDIYETLETNYYTKTETNEAVVTKIGETTITKTNGQVVNMKDAINDVIDTATEHTHTIGVIETGLLDRPTTSAMNSAISQTAQSITSTVSSTYTTKEEFNNLEVSENNLYTGTKYWSGAWYNMTGLWSDDVTYKCLNVKKRV